MNTVCKKDMCTGCMACVDICPKGAIKIEDSLEAYNACIDEEKCINCNACRKICQSCNEIELSEPIQWKQGWAADEKIRSASSSGGAAAAITNGFLEKAGIVCSCTFKDGEFIFDFAKTQEEAKEFAGSRYVKSNPKGIYKEIKKMLSEGKRILFIGLPCQAAALKRFVGEKLYENLYTIDLICHGSPSPKVLECFLADYHSSLKQMGNIQFRKKMKWHVYNDGAGIAHEGVQDIYMCSFLKGLDYTENCYSCKYATTKRVSDITLGDSWGSELLEEDNKGVSLILCQTEKGKQLIEEANLELFEVDVEKAILNNHQLEHPTIEPKERKRFLKLLQTGMSFKHAFFKCYPKLYCKKKIKETLIKMRLWVKR